MSPKLIVGAVMIKEKMSEISTLPSENSSSVVIRTIRMAKRTCVACTFCRKRKIKCDGTIPMCKHCSKRNFPCAYEPVIFALGVMKSVVVSHPNRACRTEVTESHPIARRTRVPTPVCILKEPSPAQYDMGDKALSKRMTSKASASVVGKYRNAPRSETHINTDK
ncbi:hypothetical protein BKA70DRAFT_1236607 [Coprinopsis sp. MPI-PUGE-AT-0042]|nr:hypothetical protein BKA70DRAFT_1236607 [Coprinopsis sp. MPI-PUGE-AT-0042]